MIHNMLMAAAGAGGGVIPLPPVEFIGSSQGNTNGTSASTLVMPMPPGTLEGDEMVAVITGGVNPWSCPGWVYMQAGTNQSDAGTLRRKAEAGETGPYTFTNTSGARYGGSIVTARNGVLSVIGASVSGTILNMPSVNISKDGGMLFAVVGGNSNGVTATTPAGMTLRESQTAIQPSQFVFSEAIEFAGETGIRTSTTNNNGTYGHLFAIFAPVEETVPITGSSFAATGSNTTTLTFDTPAGAEGGDLMVVTTRQDSNRAWTDTQGWTALFPDAGVQSAFGIFYREHSGVTEPLTHVFTTGTNTSRKGCICVSFKDALIGGCNIPAETTVNPVVISPVSQVRLGRTLQFLSSETAEITYSTPFGAELVTSQNTMSPSMCSFSKNVEVMVDGESVNSTASGITGNPSGVQISILSKAHPGNQAEYGAKGVYLFNVPVTQSSVSAVLVGGGGAGRYVLDSANLGGGGGTLGYKNNIAVTPGEVIPITVGAQDIAAGSFFTVAGTTYTAPGTTNNGAAAAPINCDGGGQGGVGGNGVESSQFSSGAGAGGYSGVGGNGQGGLTGGASAGAGGAGGGASNGGGGGVGLKGQGANGAVGSNGGKGGSGGEDGTTSSGGKYGGGGVASTAATNQYGGDGGIRFVWPGTTRQFPSTNVGDI